VRQMKCSRKRGEAGPRTGRAEIATCTNGRWGKFKTGIVAKSAVERSAKEPLGHGRLLNGYKGKREAIGKLNLGKIDQRPTKSTKLLREKGKKEGWGPKGMVRNAAKKTKARKNLGILKSRNQKAKRDSDKRNATRTGQADL